MTSLILPVYIVNNELLEMTERCLLSMTQELPDEVIIINDGSNLAFDETNYFVGITKAKIISFAKNYGYTMAVNTGLQAAKGDIIIIANNDLTFPEGWLTGLLKPLKEGWDISTVATEEGDHEVIPVPRTTTGGKFGSIWAMKRKVYEKVGPLDVKLGRGYFTDLDFQKRAEDLKFKVGKNHGMVIQHEAKATYKIVDPDDTQYLEAKEKFRKKWGSVW